MSEGGEKDTARFKHLCVARPWLLVCRRSRRLDCQLICTANRLPTPPQQYGVRALLPQATAVCGRRGARAPPAAPRAADAVSSLLPGSWSAPGEFIRCTQPPTQILGVDIACRTVRQVAQMSSLLLARLSMLLRPPCHSFPVSPAGWADIPARSPGSTPGCHTLICRAAGQQSQQQQQQPCRRWGAAAQPRRPRRRVWTKPRRAEPLVLGSERRASGLPGWPGTAVWQCCAAHRNRRAATAVAARKSSLARPQQWQRGSHRRLPAASRSRASSSSRSTAERSRHSTPGRSWGGGSRGSGCRCGAASGPERQAAPGLGGSAAAGRQQDVLEASWGAEAPCR